MIRDPLMDEISFGTMTDGERSKVLEELQTRLNTLLEAYLNDNKHLVTLPTTTVISLINLACRLNRRVQELLKEKEVQE